MQKLMIMRTRRILAWMVTPMDPPFLKVGLGVVEYLFLLAHNNSMDLGTCLLRKLHAMNYDTD